MSALLVWAECLSSCAWTHSGEGPDGEAAAEWAAARHEDDTGHRTRVHYMGEDRR